MAKKTTDDKLRAALAKNPPQGGVKDTFIQIRVASAKKAAYEDAAARRGMSLSEWLLYVADLAVEVE